MVLGLGRVRSAWFRDVAQWSNSAALPAEFIKCVSAEELRSRLCSGRPISAVLLDASLPTTDRDLIDAAREFGAAAFVVTDGRIDRDWLEKTLTDGFADKFNCVFPPDALDDKLHMLHKLGYGGTAYDMLIGAGKRKRKRERR